MQKHEISRATRLGWEAARGFANVMDDLRETGEDPCEIVEDWAEEEAYLLHLFMSVRPTLKVRAKIKAAWMVGFAEGWQDADVKDNAERVWTLLMAAPFEFKEGKGVPSHLLHI